MRSESAKQVGIRIVRVGEQQVDIAAPLFDLYRQFYKRPSDLAAARTFLRERLRRQESVLYLAFAGQHSKDIAAGFVHLYPTFSSLSMRAIWILSDLFVVPEARKQGIGRALMETARTLAMETQSEGLILETGTDNFVAQRLYESLGYRRDEAFYRYYLLS